MATTILLGNYKDLKEYTEKLEKEGYLVDYSTLEPIDKERESSLVIYGPGTYEIDFLAYLNREDHFKDDKLLYLNCWAHRKHFEKILGDKRNT